MTTISPSRFFKMSPPPKAKAQVPGPESSHQEARVKEKSSGKFWKTAALLGLAGAGIAGGMQMMQPTDEVVIVDTDVSTGDIDLEKSEVGIAAVPEDWIPTGESHAYAESPFGVARGTTTRTPNTLFLDLDGRINPDMSVTDIGDGRVKILVDLPGPFDQTSTGTLTRDGDVVKFRSDNGKTTATVSQGEDGTVEATLKRKGWAEWNLSYQGY